MLPEVFQCILRNDVAALQHYRGVFLDIHFFLCTVYMYMQTPKKGNESRVLQSERRGTTRSMGHTKTEWYCMSCWRLLGLLAETPAAWNARAKSDGLLSHFVQEQKHTEATCKSIAAEKVELSKVHVCYHVWSTSSWGSCVCSSQKAVTFSSTLVHSSFIGKQWRHRFLQTNALPNNLRSSSCESLKA